MDFRVGIGYDVHRLVDDRPLIIGGAHIRFEKGLLGHSDADVLLHAVMDALLGACGQGDIGKHFPDSDKRYEGISSMKLLEEVRDMLNRGKWRVVNVDSVIVAQKPKLAPYINIMVNNIASCLNIPEEVVNIKATTEEGLGFTGAMAGISAQAVCLLEKM